MSLSGIGNYCNQVFDRACVNTKKGLNVIQKGLQPVIDYRKKVDVFQKSCLVVAASTQVANFWLNRAVLPKIEKICVDTSDVHYFLGFIRLFYSIRFNYTPEAVDLEKFHAAIQLAIENNHPPLSFDFEEKTLKEILNDWDKNEVIIDEKGNKVPFINGPIRDFSNQEDLINAIKRHPKWPKELKELNLTKVPLRKTWLLEKMSFGLFANADLLSVPYYLKHWKAFDHTPYIENFSAKIGQHRFFKWVPKVVEKCDLEQVIVGSVFTGYACSAFITSLRLILGDMKGQNKKIALWSIGNSVCESIFYGTILAKSKLPSKLPIISFAMFGAKLFGIISIYGRSRAGDLYEV